MIFKFFQNKPIRFKVVLVNIFIIVFTLTVVGTVSYQQTSKLFETKINDYSSQIVKQLSIKINYYIEEMNKVSFLINASSDINSIILKESSSNAILNELERYNSVTQYLTNLKMFQSFPFNIYFYSNTDESYTTNSMGRINTEEIKKFQWFKDLRSSNLLKPVILIDNVDKSTYLYLARNIYDPDTKRILGTAVVEASESVIEKDINKVDLGKGALILITDDHGNIIFNTPKDVNTEQLKIINQISGQNPYSVQVSGNHYLISSEVSDFTNWGIIGAIPRNSLMGDFVKLIRITFISLAICFIIALILSIMLSYSITKPIHKLRNLMKVAENGDFSVSFNETRGDEVGQLGKSFNKMLMKIKELINTVYEVRLKEREAELNALQSQINPHFLYNTLESISITALLNNDMDAVNMIGNLVKFFRYNVIKGRDFIEISKEIEHINNYLEIQKYRFKDKFQVFIDIEKEVYKCKIFKLALQPLVENAIYHGLERKKGVGCIRIRGLKDKNVVRISVIDDGIGITHDALEKLNKTLNDSKSINTHSNRSIGLRNVQERIQLHFGEEYGLDIKSKSGEGTEITLSLPIIKNDMEVPRNV